MDGNRLRHDCLGYRRLVGEAADLKRTAETLTAAFEAQSRAGEPQPVLFRQQDAPVPESVPAGRSSGNDRVDYQQCLAFLLRRCLDVLATAIAAAICFQRFIFTLVKWALDLPDRFPAGDLSDCGLSVQEPPANSSGGHAVSSERQVLPASSRHRAFESTAPLFHLPPHLRPSPHFSPVR